MCKFGTGSITDEYIIGWSIGLGWLMIMGYRYNKDIKYVINPDGTVDAKLSSSGDIELIGENLSDDEAIAKQNAVQQVILRLITPYGILKDANENPINFGSQLYTMIGAKTVAINILTIKALALYSLYDYNMIEEITKLDVDFSLAGTVKIKFGIKFRDLGLVEDEVEIG